MSKTEENLKAAFAGESQARNKYTYWARVAEKEGHMLISRIFMETAENEKAHAKEEFKLLKGIGSTKENLKHAIEGEHYETNQMYPQFEKEALKEGNKEAAKLFKELAEVEAKHEARYKKLLDMLDKGTLYKRKKEIAWKCTNCGYIHHGKEAPDKCPACHHPREFYEPECICFHEECDICN